MGVLLSRNLKMELGRVEENGLHFNRTALNIISPVSLKAVDCMGRAARMRLENHPVLRRAR
jgi:hypothetical protein